MTERDVVQEVKRQAQAVGSPAELARRWGMSKVHVYDVISGKRSPGPEVLKRLGLVKVVRYQPRQSPAEK